MRRYLLLLLVFLAFPAQALEVTDLRIKTVEGGERISLALDHHAKVHLFRVDNPPRVVVDMPTATLHGIKAKLPQGYNGSFVKGVRFGFHDARTSRMVFDLTANAKIRHSWLTPANDVYWLQFDLAAPGNTASAEPQERETAANETPRERQSQQPRTEQPRSERTHAERTREEQPRVEKSRHREAKPLIVIDPGHGGQDPGTAGFSGTQEKRVTLAYALVLEEELLRTGHYRVMLTREDDRYLFLRDRVAKARAAKGDLFISLHADSAPSRTARGLSVYTLSEKSSDKEAAALAAKENKADVIGGMDLSDASEDVADILIDLTRRETRAKSAQFADLLVRSLSREVSLLSNTHRFAGFAVLKAPDIPSVLIEVGFLTSPHEESLLKNPGYQAKIVRGIVRAVDGYFYGGKRR